MHARDIVYIKWTACIILHIWKMQASMCMNMYSNPSDPIQFLIIYAVYMCCIRSNAYTLSISLSNTDIGYFLSLYFIQPVLQHFISHMWKVQSITDLPKIANNIRKKKVSSQIYNFHRFPISLSASVLLILSFFLKTLIRNYSTHFYFQLFWLRAICFNDEQILWVQSSALPARAVMPFAHVRVGA